MGKKKNEWRCEGSLRDLCSSHYGSPRKKKEKWVESLFKEIIPENFPNLGEKIENQIHKAQRIPNKMKEIHTKTNCQKLKTEFWNSKRKMTCYTQGNPLKTMRRFFSKILQSWIYGSDTIYSESWKEKKNNYQPGVLILTNMSFKNKGKVKDSEIHKSWRNSFLLDLPDQTR